LFYSRHEMAITINIPKTHLITGLSVPLAVLSWVEGLHRTGYLPFLLGFGVALNGAEASLAAPAIEPVVGVELNIECIRGWRGTNLTNHD